MTETEATDHLEDAQEMLRGARWASKPNNQAAGRHLHAVIDAANMLVDVAT